MDALRQRRGPIRTSFTKTANTLDGELGGAIPDTEKIAELLAQLEDKGKKLSDIDNELGLLLQGSGCSQEDYDAHYIASEAYIDRLIGIRSKVSRLLVRLENSRQENELPRDRSRRKYRLPELELKRFGGDLKDWLGFWGQFRKIHEDVDMDAEDKFQYLLQSTVPNSRARELVESFPPTKDSYAKAIDCLKSRFGRDDTLVEVYVRELLRLVLNNALYPKQKTPLPVLYDKLEAQLRSLETLGVASEKYAAMLYPLVESCLPEEVLRAWERNRGVTTVGGDETQVSGSATTNHLSLLMNFLRSEVEGEERIHLARTGFGLEQETRKKGGFKPVNEGGRDVPTAAGFFGGTQGSKPQKGKAEQVCLFCGRLHSSSDCKESFMLSLDERRAKVIQARCCFICLKRGHRVRTCHVNVTCTVCGRRHATVMCPEKQTGQSTVTTTQDSKPSASNPKDCALSNHTCSSDVFLQTLLVRMRGPSSDKIVRVLIDTGSQHLYVKEELANEMFLPCLGKKDMAHCLFGGIQSDKQPHTIFRVHVGDLQDTYRCNFQVFGLSVICGDVPKIRSGVWVDELKHKKISLSDMCLQQGAFSNVCINSGIDILIGADVAGKIFTGRLSTLQCGPVAIETKLGWTLMGRVPETQDSSSTLFVTSLFCREPQLSDLWTLDILGIKDPAEKRAKDELEHFVLQDFNESIIVNDEGRYEVALPWVEGSPHLPDNKGLAEKRLKSTCAKMNSMGILLDYQKIFDEWLDEGIIEEVPLCEQKKGGHYLPHRAVVREGTATTKIRPVFDASAKEKGNRSLNDCLERGPNLIDQIPSVITRFRLNRIGISFDVRKAFLQISVGKRDRDYLRFLWWRDGNREEQRVFRHCRVVFGVTSSPFLLGATLAYHFQHAPVDLQEISLRLEKSFYVDNCVTSVCDEQELESFILQSRELLSLAKFELHEWRHGSDKNILEMGPYGESSQPQKFEEASRDRRVEENVLGLYWNPEKDTLRSDMRGVENLDERPITKRLLLSMAHRIFDPIGFLCPVMLFPKLLLQECWKLGIKWDEELPDPLSKRFREWYEQLHFLQFVEIPRWLFKTKATKANISVHVFCDASQEAYATCIFIRADTENGVSIQLVQARARVAPAKTVTIPRLELLSCLIGARLAKTVRDDLEFLHENQFFFWTDSSNALHWIKRDEAWGVFVENRAREIRALSSPDNWRHLPGHLNPADLPSRGCSVQRLRQLQWWEGPAWLALPGETWPKSDLPSEESSIYLERKRTEIVMLNCQTESNWYGHRLSSYLKIVRMIAWLYRFCDNCRRQRGTRATTDLSVEEVERAEKSLVAIIQQEAFSGVTDIRLRSLHPVLDERGILRVKTPLLRRDDTEDFLFPVILPSKHHVVTLLIMWHHRRMCHAGVQTLMVYLRQFYWIIHSRRTIRQVVHSCVRCKRFGGKKIETLPASLPSDRVKDSHVFAITGVDLAGPLILKGGSKAWVVLYTCAIYRAVHLELVTSLSTSAFLQSFRRFVARRGRPTTIYSDNGKNFVGADNAFKAIDWDVISTQATIRRIVWKFNPPSAAWWGGWWERLVGLVKQLLRRVLGRASLVYEELYTVLCECENVVNFRPLTYLTEDSQDLRPLVPAMFLQGIPESRLPDVDTVEKTALTKRERYVHRLRGDLRKRFRDEYLGFLRQSTLPKGRIFQVKVGDVVLLGADNLKRLDWPLARITHIYPSSDGQVRVVLVKTSTGIFKRPVQKLFPLEMQDEIKENARLDHLPFISSKEEQSSQIQKQADEKDKQNLTTTRSGRISKPPERLHYKLKV